jgi:hypothetical protein
MAERETALGTCLAQKCKIFLGSTGAGYHFNTEKESGWVRMTFSFERRTTVEALRRLEKLFGWEKFEWAEGVGMEGGENGTTIRRVISAPDASGEGEGRKLVEEKVPFEVKVIMKLPEG